MKMWIENTKGEKYQIDTLSDSDIERSDIFFDELSKITGRFKFITLNDFKLKDPMIIDVMHPTNESIKIGELTCERLK